MAKNRKISKKMSVHAANTVRFGGIILALGVMIIVNVLSSSSCDQLVNENGRKASELAKLDASYQRESTRWEEMKTPENIDRALVRHGLKMAPPRAHQWIRLNANGVPCPNQLALTRLRQRSGTATTASYKTAPRRAASAKARAR
jgi:hypothetical protein